MFTRIIFAIIWGVIVAIAALIVGAILLAIPAEPVKAIGTLVTNLSWLLGLLAALYYLVSGREKLLQ